MINKIKGYIEEHQLLETGQCIVVAVSGGPDSIALLKVLDMVSNEYKLTLIAAHLNHGLREEASEEEQFVRRISKELMISFECETADIKSMKKNTGKSTEDMSRIVRYRFLNAVAKKHRAHKIALGHHLNDQSETVLINFLRGSGPEGLKGMLPARDSLYIRPLLAVSRKEILSFLDFHKIPFMTDSSNMEEVFLRNRVRHLLIPELKEKYNPKLEEGLNNMAEIIRLEDDYMKTVTDKILLEWDVEYNDDKMKINLSELKKYHEAIQKRILKTLLLRSTPDSQGIGYAHIKSVFDFVHRNHPSGCLNLPHNIVVYREYGSLFLARWKKLLGENHSENHGPIYFQVTLPGSLNVPQLGKIFKFTFVEPPVRIKSDEDNIVYMDYNRIVLPLIIRTVKPGDRIQPLGMRGTKKIKSYFIDVKMPINKRKKLPLLVDNESIIWIVGMRMSERVKITEKTRQILKVEIV